jgi:predicted RNase H-like HicB family nuclease
MGGLRTELYEDRYPNGEKCFVASHPDREDCVAYADTANEALRLLDAARAVCNEFEALHGSSSLSPTTVIMRGRTTVERTVEPQEQVLNHA